jgi:rubrerythrin
MPPLPEKFRAAIEEGVRDIKGKLDKLNADEKRQLLADLREHEDCPDGWKNRKNMAPKKRKSILDSLNQAIEKLLDPDKVKTTNARIRKKNKENGKQKAANAIFIAKRAKATREANARAILENKDHKEPTWDEATLEKKATEIVKYIVEKCGDNGFVHVCGGAWPGKDLTESVEAECFGKGRNSHAVFIDGTNSRRKFVRYRDVSEYVELFTPYSGTNCVNADELEKRVQKKLIDMGWPQHRRMFVHAGMGSCRGKRAAGVPFPYYTCVLICEQSMEQIGIRLATKKDHAPRKKRKRSSSSL